MRDRIEPVICICSRVIRSIGFRIQQTPRPPRCRVRTTGALRGPRWNEVDMELDKQQIKRLRERHHRRHGIRPAHSEAMENATRFLKRAFNIREGRAPYHVIRKRFVNGARLTGSHLCILIIAMLIASIGLDIDSDIAIVGAMLICPLMGSVLAMAYGIATLDREITLEAVASLALRWPFAWSRPRCILSSRPLAPPRPPSSTTRHPQYGTLPSRSRAALRAGWATRAIRSLRRSLPA